MALLDSLIGILVVGIFFFIIGSKIYEHEKETLDPLIAKVKGWFKTDEEGPEESFDSMDDFDLEFRGQMR